MPQENQLAHRVLSSLALPYQTNVSPTLTDPHFISGSTDLLTSINGYAERRPGFSTNVEATPTTFNSLQRLFSWDRFDGVFIIMACDINASGFAVVYKLQVGMDASFVSIYTEATATATPYDFVVSNNTVYFSNGFYVRKWDPINGLSNWGIAQYAANASSAAFTGTGANNASVGTVAWVNPTNVQGAPDTVYTTMTVPAGPTYSNYLFCTNFGFTIPSGNTVSGIQGVIRGHVTNGFFPPLNGVGAYLLIGGSVSGSPRFTSIGLTVDANGTIGGPTDLWGLSAISPALTNAVTFGLAIFCSSTAAHGQVFSLDSCQVTVFNSGAPNVTFVGTGLTASTGYQYVLCYGNSNTGHVSSPSPVTNLVKPVNQGMSIPVVASSDAQVNQIRIFRTTDSASGLGGQSYFEIPNSPVPNTTAAITDNAPDISLNALSIAPTPTFNDPPTPIQGMVYFSGRIWGFTGNKVWFTGLEEITIGVPEECMPSGIAGNFWAFDQPVQALMVAGIGANQGLAVLCGGRFYGIQGNSLDTFVRFQLSNRRGARNRTCVSGLGGMMGWLDSANQVWATDGTNLNELSTLIRNDLSGITQASCSLTFHTAGRFHWLVLSTGTKLYVYDVDQDQWMPPWSFAATYIYSGEISPGNYVLMASNGTKALQLNVAGTAGTFNDNGATYQPVLKFGLLSVVPDYGSRFSYIGVGSYNEPTRTGYPSVFQLTNNGNAISDFLICQDDDPTVATYQSIVANKVDTVVAFNRQNGTTMTQQVFPTIQPAARWIGMEIKLANADQADNLYELFMAYKGIGGR
jgi:hypothetical protein